YLVAGAGALVLNVVGVKPRANATSAILDGGTNVFGLPSMRLGFRPLHILPLTSGRTGEPTSHALFGPLCTPGDKVCESVLLPPLTAGDRRAILHAGAYGLTAARGAFRSFAPAREMLITNERVEADELRSVLAGIVPHIERTALELGVDDPLPLDSMG